MTWRMSSSIALPVYREVVGSNVALRNYFPPCLAEDHNDALAEALGGPVRERPVLSYRTSGDICPISFCGQASRAAESEGGDVCRL